MYQGTIIKLANKIIEKNHSFVCMVIIMPNSPPFVINHETHVQTLLFPENILNSLADKVTNLIVDNCEETNINIPFKHM